MSTHPQFWWFLARASGLTAWALALASVLLGLALATRALGARPRAPWLLDLHRFVGAASVAFVGVHLAALVADHYVTFSWADLFLPFASEWKPGAVALGVVAWWILVAVEVSSLLLRRLPKRVWRSIHLGSYGVAVLSTAHAFTAGTDADNRLLLAATIGVAAATAFFLAYRRLAPARSRSRVTASLAARTTPTT